MSEKHLFLDVYNEYLLYANKKQKEQSFVSLKYKFNSHILPFFKDMYLEDISSKNILSWEEYIISLGFSNNYNKNLYYILSGFFEYCRIFYNFDKKIISIDGGTGVKFISQLNALIIENDGKNLTFKNHFVQPLPIYRTKQDKFVENKENHKVSWPNFEIEILEKREEFSFCKVIHTNQMLWIKNEFIYLKNKHFYCLDDYIDHFITVHENEDVKVIGLYGKFAYIIKNKEIGWIESGYLEKI